jgi:hypothetical protein
MPPLISSSGPPPSWIDEETRQVVLKKTWCHGQLVAPIYSLVLLWWHFSKSLSIVVWIPILYFPFWCYLSYKNVFADFSLPNVMIGGIVAEICHIIVLTQTIRSGLDQTTNMILCVVSSLFLVETLAFLCVVMALRPRESAVANPTTFLVSSNVQYHDSGRPQ